MGSILVEFKYYGQNLIFGVNIVDPCGLRRRSLPIADALRPTTASAAQAFDPLLRALERL